MVELELLQRGERAVALLGEREPPLARPRPARRARPAGLGLAQERQRDRDDARHGERGASTSAKVTRLSAGRPLAGRRTRDEPPLLARVGPQRDERAEQEDEAGEPDQVHERLDEDAKVDAPSGSICSAMTKRSSPVSQSVRIPTSFETCCSIVYAFFPACDVPSCFAPRDVERRADLGRVRRRALLERPVRQRVAADRERLARASFASATES